MNRSFGNKLRKYLEYVKRPAKVKSIIQSPARLGYGLALRECETKVALNRTRVQIYEVQTPQEAEAMIRLGVDHVGSVLLGKDRWKDRTIRSTVEEVKRLGAKSSLIPLFCDEETLCRALEYHRPDIVHFCDMLEDSDSGKTVQDRLSHLQSSIRERFDGIRIMRSIPIARSGNGELDSVLAIARRFEPISDYFLTDTVMPSAGVSADAQPVSGFVGITGVTCNWDHARALVETSAIPVILAGGISPENVEEGIAAVGPAGVDSCTCTNATGPDGKPVRFRKDPKRVEDLIEGVRRAETRLRTKS
jgi:phosphoribosylanthranilate isomerase